MKIDKDFQALLPTLSEQECNLLTESILNEGIRDPIVIWQEEQILLDGHNRLKIYLENKQKLNNNELPIRELSFSNKEDAKLWIIMNQLGRRNLTTERRKYYLGILYNKEKQQGQRTDLTSGQNGTKLNTAQRLSDENKVSVRTIKRAGKYVENLDKITVDAGLKKYKEKILDGRIKLSVSEVDELANNDEYTEYLEDVFYQLEDKIVKSATEFMYNLNKSLKKEKEISEFNKLIYKLKTRLDKLISDKEVEDMIISLRELINKAEIKMEEIIKNGNSSYNTLKSGLRDLYFGFKNKIQTTKRIEGVDYLINLFAKLLKEANLRKKDLEENK